MRSLPDARVVAAVAREQLAELAVDERAGPGGGRSRSVASGGDSSVATAGSSGGGFTGTRPSAAAGAAGAHGYVTSACTSSSPRRWRPSRNAELDEEGAADDPPAEPLDQADGRRRRAAGGQHVVDDRARGSPGHSASSWISSASVPYSSAYSSRTGRPRQLAGLAHRHEPGAEARTATGAAEEEAPRLDADDLRRTPVAGGPARRCRSTARRNAGPSASSGVMSLKTMPGCGKSGMSRIFGRSASASSIPRGYRRRFLPRGRAGRARSGR